MTSNSNTFIEILKITLPALVVFLTAYFFFKDMIENLQRQREFEFRVQSQGKLSPIRLQAYERLTLLLERISPQSLLSRLSPQNKTPEEYHSELLHDIRQEYEHNLSQQIYVSPIAWEALKVAKESLVRIINIAAENLDSNATGVDLNKKVIELYIEQKDQPVSVALNELKKGGA